MMNYISLIDGINSSIKAKLSEKYKSPVTTMTRDCNIFDRWETTYTDPDTLETTTIISYHNTDVKKIYDMMDTLDSTKGVIAKYLKSVFDDDGRYSGITSSSSSSGSGSSGGTVVITPGNSDSGSSGSDSSGSSSGGISTFGVLNESVQLYSDTTTGGENLNFFNLNNMGSAFSNYDIYNSTNDTFTEFPQFGKISEYFLGTVGRVDKADYIASYRDSTIASLLNIMTRYQELFKTGDYEDIEVPGSGENDPGYIIKAEANFWTDYKNKFLSEITPILNTASIMKKDFTALEQHIYDYIKYGTDMMEKMVAISNFMSSYNTESYLFNNKLAMFDETGYSVMKQYNNLVGISFESYSKACSVCVNAPRVKNKTEKNVTQFISKVAYYTFLNRYNFYNDAKSRESSIYTLMKRYKLI